MNRKERRSAEKKGGLGASGPQAPGPLPTMPIVEDAVKPSLVLRALARIMLSRFVLKRVHHPQVLFMLGEVARQARRVDALMYIQTKLPQ